MASCIAHSIHQVDPGGMRDPELAAKLEAEIPAILRWLIAGCLSWQQMGLCPPDRVLAATSKYREESDRLKMFIDERCVLENGRRVSVTRFYELYKQSIEQRGENAIGLQRLDSQMEDRWASRENVTRKVGAIWASDSASSY